MNTDGLVVTAIVGLIFIFLGYLIWFKKMLFLISGFNESTFKGDKEKLAKRTGLVLFTCGVVTIGFPFFLYWLGNIVGVLYCLIAVLGIGLIFWTKR